MLDFETFLVAALILNITPGADMTFVLASSVSQGRNAGVAAALGIGAGGFGHVLAGVFGLSAILHYSATAFTVLKVAGAVYLFFLAVQTLRGGGLAVRSDQPTQTLCRVFRNAACVNLLNPKVALFMLAFLPQFVDPQTRQPALQILILGSVFCCSGTVVNVLVAVFSSHIRSLIHGSENAQKALRIGTASVLGGLGLKIALLQR